MFANVNHVGHELIFVRHHLLRGHGRHGIAHMAFDNRMGHAEQFRWFSLELHDAPNGVEDAGFRRRGNGETDRCPHVERYDPCRNRRFHRNGSRMGAEVHIKKFLDDWQHKDPAAPQRLKATAAFARNDGQGIGLDDAQFGDELIDHRDPKKEEESANKADHERTSSTRAVLTA